MKKISIVIPIYNVAKYIRKSLLSALNQSYPYIEYIIIDDRGQDNSMDIVLDIVENFKSKDIKIEMHENNRGLSAARNTGIMKATGDFIYFMDSDDVISYNCIEILYNAIMQTKSEWVDANINVIGGSNRVLIPYKNELSVSNELISDFFKGKIHLSAWNKLIDRKWLLKEKIRFIEGLIYEDLLFVFTLCKHAKSGTFVNYFTYDYIIRKGSITTTISEQSLKKQYDSILYNLLTINKCKEDFDNIEIQTLVNKWLERYRFKSLVRLTTIDINNDSIIIYYYKKISSIRFEYNHFNIYELLMKLPYSMFYIIFKIPYKIYKLINR